MPMLCRAPRSAASWTTSCDMPTACLPPNPICVNMSPKRDAASIAARSDRPNACTEPRAHDCITAALSPKIAPDFCCASDRSRAASFADTRPVVSWVRAPAAAPPMMPPANDPAAAPIPAASPWAATDASR